MSLLARKRSVRTVPTVVRKRARDAAERAVPIAKQAVPIAKQAGIAARQTAEDAVAWAAPHVDEARSWAAPHIERTGIAVRDTIAPRISDALVTAAHRLETTPPKRRRWPRVLVGLTLLAAIASAAAAAIARRNRPDPFSYEPASPPAADAAASPSPDDPDRAADGAASQEEAKVNGQVSTS